MRSILLFIFFHISAALFCQVSIKGPWTAQLGASTNKGFKESTQINIRYISPRFRWSEDWDPEEEKDPDKFRNMRIMLELIACPPAEAICAGFGAQYRLVKFKRFSMYVNGGLKFIIKPGSDFVTPRYRANHSDDAWYVNMSLISQLDLGFILPFVDIGGDGIFTVGSEFNLRKIYKRTKRRYNFRKPNT